MDTEHVEHHAEDYEDMTLVCVGLPEDPCKKEFVWTANDQAFYANQTPPFSKPKRCRACAKRKREQFSNTK